MSVSKNIIFPFFFLAALLFSKSSQAANDTIYLKYNSENIIFLSDTLQKKSPSAIEKPVTTIKKLDDEKRQKIISAMLAFPFPFGFMGAHRVMLGCKPWVPVVYVATFGGCFGLLPLIDFCVIVFSKDIKQYENNPHIFMWLK